MRPLIEIQTIPIEIQMKTTNAHLEYARGTAQMEVSRDRRGLQIRSQPIRVNIDTFEARSSIVPTTPRASTGGSPGTACGIRGYRRPGAGGPHDDGGQN
mgnify:CR=1 FL=1